MKENKITYIVGDELPKISPLLPYSELVCEFLDEFSKMLRSNKENSQYTDLISLAFWCRKSNILKLKQNFKYDYAIGRGLVFHITPSNVPINFAFSYFFGLLSGNSNIVRIPQKNYPQIRIICEVLNQLFEMEKYKVIKEMTLLVSYQRDDEITAYYSSICDGRIIWGGDEAIRNIRKFSLKERAIEVVFSDRYSFAVIDVATILNMKEQQRAELANKFYNDTYLMDQNACSTPHLIIWKGRSEVDKTKAQKMFWNSVAQIAVKYDLADIKVVDKYTSLCQVTMESSNVKSIQRYENLLYCIELSSVNEGLTDLRGEYGMFFEYHINDFEEVAKSITSKIQTVIYVGIDPKEIIECMARCHLTGIDRIVPMGEALNMNVKWDGYDIIGQLVRHIEVR